MVEIREITVDEVREFRSAMFQTFASDLIDTPERAENFHALMSMGDATAAFDDGRIVGTFGTRTFPLTVPGGDTISMAGTTMVSVMATHRRRGLMTAMMRDHLAKAIDRGSPVAGLWASEVPIYGRFGYGVATYATETEFHGNEVTLPAGRQDLELRYVDAAEAARLLPPAYDTFRSTVAGMLGRSSDWWTRRALFDDDASAEGASRRRILVASDGDTVTGYVLYRQKTIWERAVPKGTVVVEEMAATDDGTRQRLWHFISKIDLCPNVKFEFVPVDDPVFLEVDDPRKMTRQTNDAVWLRILDVPTALTARTYEIDGALTLQVDDTFLDHGGTWDLDVANGTARCDPSTREPHVRLTIDALANLYLGAPGVDTLNRTGRIAGADAALTALASIFATRRAPFCSTDF